MMNMQEFFMASVALILTFSKKPNLQEFELLAYEQACRAAETILRETREVFNERELENYQG